MLPQHMFGLLRADVMEKYMFVRHYGLTSVQGLLEGVALQAQNWKVESSLVRNRSAIRLSLIQAHSLIVRKEGHLKLIHTLHLTRNVF